ncbi:MAG: AMP-binding protein [Proteobacteria bacterium]|nr:AMP-binding protein [Pseudomonadota bacterium]
MQLKDNTRGQVPAQYNLARECCGRWAAERTRLALYYEDASGLTQAYGFWDIQRAANRLSNALGALGTLRGERIAIILPQRPETAIAHIACYQMGAIAVPLSPLLGQETLASPLGQAAARIAVVDNAALPQLWAVRQRLPQLRHIIGVGGALENGVHDWSRLLEYASPRYTPLATSAASPALLIHAGDDQPRATLLAQNTLLDVMSGFVCAHDFFPKAGDMFWSPADWGSPAGLFDALLPAWNFGQPILACRDPFDPEKACWLMAKYGVRNAFLPPGALDSMMQAVPKSKEQYGPELNLRTLVSSGKAADETLKSWAREELGVGIKEIQARCSGVQDA